MISANKLSKYYGEQVVFSELTFTIAPEHKVALTGFNGVGKSTLLKIFAGEETFSNGVLQINKKARVGYLPQDMNVHDDLVIKDFIYDIPDDDFVTKDDVFDRSMLIYFAGFSLDEAVLSRTFGTLSSGQKTKVVLTKLLLQKPTLLLLDEPTNNLDLPARIWLEAYIQKINATCVIISHDETFLTRTTNKIFEIDWHSHTLHVSNAKYSDYLKEKEKQFEQQQKEHKLDKTEISRLQASAKWRQARGEAGKKWKGTDNDKMLIGHKRNRAARSFTTAKVTYNRIKRMDVTEKPEEREELTLGLGADKTFEDVQISPDIKVKDVVCGQGDFLTPPITIDIPHKKTICFVGENGVGKSTIVKTIAGVLEPVQGELHRAETVRFAHVMQEHESLPADMRVFDFLFETIKPGFKDVIVEGEEVPELNSVEIEEKHKKEITEVLDGHSFTEHARYKEIGKLSPGERLRLLFLYFSLLDVNVLLLDEPTNHIDSEALFALKQSLREFEGTIIVVSHDRAFIDEMNFKSIYEVSEQGIVEIENMNAYVAAMEQKAKKLVRMLG
jgi:ATP-binding cassette subfamily F protein 3